MPEEMPKWLDLELVRSLGLFTSEFEIKSACKKGENFASKVYRVLPSFDDRKIR